MNDAGSYDEKAKFNDELRRYRNSRRAEHEKYESSFYLSVFDKNYSMRRRLACVGAVAPLALCNVENGTRDSALTLSAIAFAAALLPADRSVSLEAVDEVAGFLQTCGLQGLCNAVLAPGVELDESSQVWRVRGRKQALSESLQDGSNKDEMVRTAQKLAPRLENAAFSDNTDRRHILMSCIFILSSIFRSDGQILARPVLAKLLKRCAEVRGNIKEDLQKPSPSDEYAKLKGEKFKKSFANTDLRIIADTRTKADVSGRLIADTNQLLKYLLTAAFQLMLLTLSEQNMCGEVVRAVCFLCSPTSSVSYRFAGALVEELSKAGLDPGKMSIVVQIFNAIRTDGTEFFGGNGKFVNLYVRLQREVREIVMSRLDIKRIHEASASSAEKSISGIVAHIFRSH